MFNKILINVFSLFNMSVYKFNKNKKKNTEIHIFFLKIFQLH